MLTTVDNPFNPWTQWDAWVAYDSFKGYGTLSYLGRIIHTSDELSESDQELAYDDAINEIISNDETNFYKIAINPTQ